MIPTSENDLRKKMISKIGNRAHFSMIESHATSSGFPDCYYCCEGFKGTIEIKWWGTNAKKKPKIRPAQIAWHREEVKAGGMPIVLIGYEAELSSQYIYALYPGNMLGKLQGMSTKSMWVDAATIKWRGGIPIEEIVHYMKYPKSLYCE